MNKFTKASVAGAVGIALLLGGAGSFATWNASASLSAGSITAGSMTMTAPTAGAWSNITKGTAVAVNPGTFHMVPGNTLKYVGALNISGEGDDLTAELTSNVKDLVQGDIAATVALTSSDSNIVAIAGNQVTLKKAGSATVTVTITLTFASTATGQQNAVADLGTLKFTLTQVDPSL
jgi:alternate signal-mediated exported protein